MGYDLKEAMDFLVTLNDEARKPHNRNRRKDIL